MLHFGVAVCSKLTHSCAGQCIERRRKGKEELEVEEEDKIKWNKKRRGLKRKNEGRREDEVKKEGV